MDTHRFDVLVIGAGMAGATAAAHLSATRKVALLEAEESAGYHSTGRSAAIWIQNYGPPDVRVFTGLSRKDFEEPAEGFAPAPLAHKRPVMFLAPQEQQAHLTEMLSAGIGLQPLDLAEAKQIIPALRPSYATGAAIERDAFDMDVAGLHQGYLRQMKAAGGVLALRHRANRIWKENGMWFATGADGDVYSAPVVVNAAGAWGDVVAEAAGVKTLGLVPKRRTALVIDPGPYDVENWPMTNDVDHTWYIRPEARTKLMVSPADETDDVPHDVQPDELDIAIAVDRMQQALDIPVRRVEHSWAGLRTFAPDRSLCFGESEEAGFFWMCGQGGYGIQTAPAAGRYITALINGTAPEPELLAIKDVIDPRRFARAAAAA